jgi:hypothetical protein
MSKPLILTTLLAALASGCFYTVDPGSNSDGTITIDNASSYVLSEVRVTPVHSSSWGPNLLSSALYPDQRLTVSVACDTYDVLISDQYARDCTLGAIDLCFSDQLWVIDNVTLRTCAF